MISRAAVLLSSGLCASSACGRGDAPKPTSVVAETTSSSSNATASGSPTPEGPALFVYEEDDDVLSYWSSGALRLVMPTAGSPKTCDGALCDKDNMWTRDDVRAAFDHADVQQALSIDGLYRSAYPSRARLVVGAHTITWVNAWKELPPPEPEAVHHLHEVLHVVLENRAALCR
jgi:hypothetical protein